MKNMPHPKTNPPRISLVAGIILIALTLLVGVTVFIVMQRHAAALLSKSLQSSLQSRVQLAVFEIHAQFDKSVLISTRPLLTDQMLLVDARTDDTAARGKLNMGAQSFLQTGPTGIALYGKDGQELTRVGVFTHQPELAVPLNLPGHVQLLWGGQLFLHAVVEMKREGRVVGKVMTEIPLPTTTDAFKEASRLGETGELALCAPFGLNMQCFPSTLLANVLTRSQSTSKGDLLPMAHALAGKTGFVSSRDYRDQEVVAAYAPVGDLGLGMVLKMDSAELYAPVWNQLRYLIPLLLGVLIIALLLLRWRLTPLVVRLVRSEVQAREMSASLGDSERRVRALLDNMDEGIVSISETGMIELFNPAAERLFGYRSFDVIGKNVSMLMPEPYHSEHDGYLARYLRTGQAKIIGSGREVTGRRSDGSVFPMDLRVSEFSLEGRRQFIGSIRDITERKRAEQALRTSEALKGAILGAALDCIVTMDHKGNIVEFNPAAERTFGFARAEVIGKSMAELIIPPALREQHRHGLAHYLATDHGPIIGKRIEMTALRADGTEFPVELAVTRVDRTESPLFAGFIRDISDRKQAEAALRESNERFQLVARATNDAIWDWNLSTDARWWNEGIQTLFGYPPEIIEPGIESWTSRIHPDDLVRIKAGIYKVIDDGGEAWADEYRFRCHNGTYADIYDRGYVIYDDAGKAARMIGAMMDLSERKQAETKLAASENRLRSIIDTEPECVKLLAADGALLEMNAAGLRMLEADSFEQVKGHSVYPIVAEEYRAAFRALTKKIFAGESGTLEFQIIGLKGTQRWLETHASPMRDANGKIIALLGITRDITERKKAAEMREALEAQLREAQKMDALGTLAGGIAHDFNNILGAIMGNVALAREELDEHHVVSANLHEIAKAGQRAKSLVEQILAFSRKQTQELTIQPLQPLLAEAIGLLRATIPAAVRFETEISKTTLYARVNATQISQVLINLVTNAWHALRKGKGQISITLDEVELDGVPLLNSDDLPPGRYVRIRVGDDGHGMDAATQARAFEPFFTTKPVGTATGLGLAVVHGLVTSHHGAITLTSTLGEGSLFEVLLPATEAPAQIASPTAVAPPTLHGEGRHVLYLDDDSAMVLLVTRLLNKRGFKVTGFEVAAEAIAAVRAAPESFDLVVTDFNMPKASGLDVARAIVEIRPDLPLVIISGYITDSLRSSARHAGVHHLVQKANSVEELAEAIAKIIALEDS